LNLDYSSLHFLPYLMPQEAHIAPRIAVATSKATTITVELLKRLNDEAKKAI